MEFALRILDVIILRVFLYWSLGVSSLSDFSLFNGIYLLFFSILPALKLKNNLRSMRKVIIYNIIILLVSGLFCSLNIAYNVFLHFTESKEKRVVTKCESLRLLLKLIGLIDIIPHTQKKINNIITSHILAAASSILTALYFIFRAKRMANLTTTVATNNNHQTISEATRIFAWNLQTKMNFVFSTISLFTIGLCGIVNPSPVSACYFLLFMVLMIMWSCNRAINPLQFKALEYFLIIFVCCHIFLVYTYHMPIHAFRDIHGIVKIFPKLLGLKESKRSPVCSEFKQLNIIDLYFYLILFTILNWHISFTRHVFTTARKYSRKQQIEVESDQENNQNNRLGNIQQMVSSIKINFQRISHMLLVLGLFGWAVNYLSYYSLALVIIGWILMNIQNFIKASSYLSPILLIYTSLLLMSRYIRFMDLDNIIWNNREKFIADFYNKIYLENAVNESNDNVFKKLLFETCCWLPFTIAFHSFVKNMRTSFYKKSFDDSTLHGVSYPSHSISYSQRLFSGFWLSVSVIVILHLSQIDPISGYKLIYFTIIFLFFCLYMTKLTWWLGVLYILLWLILQLAVMILLLLSFYGFSKKNQGFLTERLKLSQKALNDFGLRQYGNNFFNEMLINIVVIILTLIYTNYFHSVFIKSYKRTCENEQIEIMTKTKTKAAVAALMFKFKRLIHLYKGKSGSLIYDESFETIIDKILKHFDNFRKLFIRLVLLHSMKIHAGLLIYVICNHESCVINITLILTFLISSPLNRPFPFSNLLLGLSGSIIIVNMFFQLKISPEIQINVRSNCSHSRTIYDWIGILKEEGKFQYYYFKYSVLLTITVVLKYIRNIYLNGKDNKQNRYKEGILFNNCTIKDSKVSLKNFFKYLCNYSFHKIGLQVCYITSMIDAVYRFNAVTLIQIIVILCFIQKGRTFARKYWLAYIWILGFLFLAIYVIKMDIAPPEMCFLSNLKKLGKKLSISLQLLLFFGFTVKQHTLTASMINYLFCSMQYRHFFIEKKYGNDYGAGGHESKNFKDELPSIKDIKSKSVFTRCRAIVLHLINIITLCSIFINCMEPSLFSFGYSVAGLYIMWYSKRKRAHLMKIFMAIIYYNSFIIISTVVMTEISCHFLDKKGKYILKQLFNLTCENDANDLMKNVFCFACLIIQRKVMHTEGFKIQLFEETINQKFASRGLIHLKEMTMLNFIHRRGNEQLIVEKIRIKLEKLIEKQKNLGKDIPDVNEHFIAIRSGDYYLFDEDPECDDISSGDEEDESKTATKKSLTVAFQAASISHEDGRQSSPRNDPLLLSAYNYLSKSQSFRMKLSHDSQSSFYSSINKSNIFDENCGNFDSDIKYYSQSSSSIENNVASPKIYSRSKLTFKLPDEKTSSNISTKKPSDTDVSDCFNDDKDIKSSIFGQHVNVDDISMKNEITEGLFLSQVVFTEPLPYKEREKFHPTKDIHFRIINEEPNQSVLIKSKNFIKIFFLKQVETIYSITEEDRKMRQYLNAEKEIVRSELAKTTVSMKELINKPVDIDQSIEKHNLQTSLKKLSKSTIGLAPPQEMMMMDSLMRLNGSSDDVDNDTLLLTNKVVDSLHSLVMAYADSFCYLLIIINQIFYLSTFTTVAYFAIYLWAMLSIPRPTRRFYLCLLIYTQSNVLLNYLIHFSIMQTNLHISEERKFQLNFWFNIFQENYSLFNFDTMIMAYLFLMRKLLKNNGLWKPSGSNKSFYKMLVSPASFKIGLCSIRRFYTRLVTHSFAEKIDVYKYMFIIELTTLLAILIGFGKFMTLEFLKQVSGPYLLMLLTQFTFILIDRAIYLRKSIFAKLIFLIFHMSIIHALLLYKLFVNYNGKVKRKEFNETNTLERYEEFLYLLKSIYFALSAYQLKCGYPIRSFNLNQVINQWNIGDLLLFKTYWLIPFLYELHQILNWTCSRSALCLKSYMEVENIYHHIKIIKCWRHFEANCPTPRGIRYKPFILKLLIGGSLILLIIVAIFLPLWYCLIKEGNKEFKYPHECSLTIYFDGYPPIYAETIRPPMISPMNSTYVKDLFSCDLEISGYTKKYSILMFTKSESLIWTVDDDVIKNMIKREKIIIKAQLVCDKHIPRVEDKENDRKVLERVPLAYRKTLEKDTEMKKLKNILKHTGNGKSPDVLRIKNFLNIFPNLGSNDYSISSAEISLQLSLFNEIKNGTVYQRWWQIKTKLGSLEKYKCDKNTSTRSYVNGFCFIAINYLVLTDILSKWFDWNELGVIGIFVVFSLLVFRILRGIYGPLALQIHIQEIPNTDRILNIIHEIYLAREHSMFAIEEQLFAKLIFLFRSFETCIKWTRHRQVMVNHFINNMEKSIDQQKRRKKRLKKDAYKAKYVRLRYLNPESSNSFE